MTTHTDILCQTANLDICEADLKPHETATIQAHKGIQDLYRLGQLPFLELPHQKDHLKEIVTLARQKRADYESLLLLGIGGSSLGGRFLVESLALAQGHRFFLCDHLDPDVWHLWRERLDFKKTLVVVVSKSGKTIETLAAYVFFQNLLKQQLVESYRKNLVFITDPQEGLLRKIATDEGIASLSIPPGVGGRYSVLTPVGLFPAAFLGVDVEGLLLGGQRMVERCQSPDPWMNPALFSALAHREQRGRGRSLRATFPYGERLKSFAPWFAQLWAESLGKKYSLKGEIVNEGTTPLSNLGPADQHSQLQLYLEGPDDKVVTFVGTEQAENDIVLPDTEVSSQGIFLKHLSIQSLQSAERQATAQALTEAGRPHQTILLRHVDPFTVGQLIVMSELETVYAGVLDNINPFDQPAVESIKKNIPKFL